MSIPWLAINSLKASKDQLAVQGGLFYSATIKVDSKFPVVVSERDFRIHIGPCLGYCRAVIRVA